MGIFIAIVLGLSFQGFIAYLFIKILSPYSDVKTYFPDDCIIIGKRPSLNGYYVFYKKGNKYHQEWILDKKQFKEDYSTVPETQSKNALKLALEKIQNLNKNGLNENCSRAKYGGHVSWNMKAQKEQGNREFGIEAINRYTYLLDRAGIASPAFDFETLQSSGWDVVYSRRDIYTGIRSLSEEEIEELYSLIKLKISFAQTINKNLLAPKDDFFLHAYDYLHGKRLDNHYPFEFEVDRMANDLFDPNFQKVIGDKGVHIGGGFRYPEQGNFLTVGGTRSGKGTSLVLPHLLDHEAYDGSVVAIDVKGTLTAITAKKIKEKGYNLYVLDPWNLQEKIGAEEVIPSSSFNPFDILTQEEDLIDDCKMLAEMIIPIQTAKNADSHFDDRARQWVAAYILYIAKHVPKEEQTISYLRSLFKRGEDRRNDVLYDMIDNGAYSVIKENGEEIKNMFDKAEKEASSILSVILREIDVFQSIALEKNTAASSFDMADITSTKSYVYVVIPAERLNSHAKWLRLIISSVITTVLRNKNLPVLLLMDEFHSLGYMDMIVKSMGQMPEYNLQLWTIVQDLSQLKANYPDSWETFIANSAVTTWLGINDNVTADYLSRLMGTKHIKYKSNSTLRDELNNNRIMDCEKQEIPVQSALQIREKQHGIFALVKGLKPMFLGKLNYYEDPILNGNASPNPLFKPKEKAVE